jgi:hypothetical protein
VEIARKPISTSIVRTQSTNSRENFTFPSVNGTTTYLAFMMDATDPPVQVVSLSKDWKPVLRAAESTLDLRAVGVRTYFVPFRYGSQVRTYYLLGD